MKLNEEIYGYIQALHEMDAEEIEIMYESAPDSAPLNLENIKLGIACQFYEILSGKYPTELEEDQIWRCFQRLKMQEELKAYAHSRHTQSIIRRIYRLEHGIV